MKKGNYDQVQNDRSSVHEPYCDLNESSTLDDLTGMLPDGYIATYRNRFPSLTDIWVGI